MKDLNKPIKKIVILFAMQNEAQPTLKALSMSNISNIFDPRLGLKAYSSNTFGGEINIIVNGFSKTNQNICRVGTQPATLAAWESIRLLNPDLIISAGTAGGFKTKGGAIGDVYISTKEICYHDRRIPLGDYKNYGRGRYRCLEAPNATRQLNLKSGIVSSGNSLHCGDDDMAEIKEIGSSVKEMEAAAIADVAQMCDVNIIALKSITNLAEVDANAPDEFIQNFEIAVNNLTTKLIELLEFTIGKTPSQL